jgi:predicted metalloprotease
MRLNRSKRSTNVEDRRSAAPAKAAAGGGIGVLVIAAVMYFMGADPSSIMKMLSSSSSSGSVAQSQPQGGAPRPVNPAEEELYNLVELVLGDTEEVWNKVFAEEYNAKYEEPKLVVFSGEVTSACGKANAGMGPFYCPADRKIYIDLSFYEDLKRRHNAPGDFAQAYVIAHEVGHHVQNLLGTSGKLHQARGRVSEAEYNQLSVRLELQADYYAGLWAHHAHKKRQILEQGDVEEALNAASAIGDDTLQKQARGYASPESFTHGSAEQRVRWFSRGLQTGDIKQGDTFSAQQL